MSSHHIIRDEQEPALILMKTHHRWDLIDQLLEWSPTLIVFEEVAEEVLSRGVKVDLLLTTKPMSGQFQPLKTLQESSEDFFQSALYHLSSSNHDAINIFSPASFVHELVDSSSLKSFSAVNLFDGVMRHSLVRKGELKKWIVPGRYKVYPTQCNYEIEGFVESQVSPKGYLTKSDEGLIRISSGKEVFLFSEPI